MDGHAEQTGSFLNCLLSFLLSSFLCFHSYVCFFVYTDVCVSGFSSFAQFVLSLVFLGSCIFLAYVKDMLPAFLASDLPGLGLIVWVQTHLFSNKWNWITSECLRKKCKDIQKIAIPC